MDPIDNTHTWPQRLKHKIILKMMKIDQKIQTQNNLKSMNSQFKAIFIMFVPLRKIFVVFFVFILFNFLFKLIW